MAADRAGLVTASSMGLPDGTPLYEQMRRIRAHALATGAGFVDPHRGTVTAAPGRVSPGPRGSPHTPQGSPGRGSPSGTAVPSREPSVPRGHRGAGARGPATFGVALRPLPRSEAAAVLGFADAAAAAASGAPRYGLLGRLFAAAAAGGYDGVVDPITGAVLSLWPSAAAAAAAATATAAAAPDGGGRSTSSGWPSPRVVDRLPVTWGEEREGALWSPASSSQVTDLMMDSGSSCYSSGGESSDGCGSGSGSMSSIELDLDLGGQPPSDAGGSRGGLSVSTKNSN